MDPVLLIGRYPYSHWVLGMRPGGIESYRLLPNWALSLVTMGVWRVPPWLLRFVTRPSFNFSPPPPTFLVFFLHLSTCSLLQIVIQVWLLFCLHVPSPV